VALIVEIFGDYIMRLPLNTVINLLKFNSRITNKQRSFMLKEWSAITGTALSDVDFERLLPLKMS